MYKRQTITFVVDTLKRILHGGTSPIECHGDSTGSILLAFNGGVPFIDSLGNAYYNYQWYKDGVAYPYPALGQNDTMLLDSLFNGVDSLIIGEHKRVPYSLHLTDAKGCELEYIGKINTTGSIDTLTIFQQNPIYFGPVSPNSVFGPIIDSVGCKGTNTASVKVNIKGGKRYTSGNYYDLYLKDSNSDTIRRIDRNVMSPNVDSDTTPYYVLFDSLFAGDYTLHVTDSFGCTHVFDTITIAEPDSIKDLQVSPPDYNSFFCNHHQAGIKILGVSGGHQNNLSFYWEEKLPLELDSMYVSSGTYKAYIVDHIYGCKDSLYHTLTVEYPIETYVSHTDVECFGESSGSLQIDSIVGGVPLSNSSANAYYKYQWSIDTTQWLIFDTTSSSINNLSAGGYQLIIKDSLCEDTTYFIISQNSNLNLDSTITIPSCFGDLSGSIDINLTGGTPPYTAVSWIGPNGFASNDTSISNLIAGSYICLLYTSPRPRD